MHSLNNGVKNKRFKRFAVYKAIGFIAAACMIVSLLQPSAEGAAGMNGMALVNASKLYLRKSASTRARAVTSVYKGNVVKVLSKKGTWSNVTTSGGKTGWCQTKYLIPNSFKPGNTAKLDWPSEFINLAQVYTYQRCMQDMDEIAAAYSGIARVETIGNSVMGNPIRAIVLGNPDAKLRIFVFAAIHARESLTALLAMRQVECLLKAASLGAAYRGVAVDEFLRNVEIWVVPEANPDGVRLVFEGLAAVPATMPELKAALKAMNKGKTDFQRWKANGRGVDLNRNFDYNWKIDPEYPKAGPYFYAGPHPLSEPESVALKDLTVAKGFALTMSYHSSGEMMYWHNRNGVQNDLNLHIANQLKTLNKYRIMTVTEHIPNGGYRDWFAASFSKPGFTLEMGSGYTPLPQSKFSEYWQGNRFVLLELLWTVVPKSLSTYAK